MDFNTIYYGHHMHILMGMGYRSIHIYNQEVVHLIKQIKLLEVPGGTKGTKGHAVEES